MSQGRIGTEGTVKADGTLELHGPVPLPPGRVWVTIQPIVEPPEDDPFWQRMKAIWEAQKARGYVPRSVEEIEAERRALREEMEEEIEAAIRLHEECQRAKREAEAKREQPG
jgi:hypothetical protein